MTTDTLAAPAQTRPPHINPQWWARATWHARNAAISNHNKSLRVNADQIRAEEAHVARLRANVETERRAHNARYHPQLTEAVLVDDDALDTAALIETVENMLEWAETGQSICDRIGKSAGALEMRMRRADRPDLARAFNQVRNAARYMPCPGCGKRMSKRSKACRKCASRLREVSAA